MESPTGLFGGEIHYLKENKNHTHENWGKHGMIYWSHQTLKKLADLEQVIERSAICQYDGGLTRNQSDSQAIWGAV